MQQVTKDFIVYRGNLPHWQVGGTTYFITFRSLRTLADNEKAIIKDRIVKFHSKQYALQFGVIMDDHVHLLLCPLQKDDKKWYSLAEILKGMKGATAREINLLTNSSGSIWQKESFDRMIRNKDELFEKWHYIWNNPITAGLSDESIEYHYYIEPPQISASSFLEPTKVGSTKIL